MSTFSQMVDKMVLETKRPDMVNEIVTYLNQTLRELHSEPERANAVHYEANLREDLILATTESNFMWDIPNPAVFQAIRSVRYDGVIDRHGQPVWAEMIQPSRAINGVDYFYYRSGSKFAFAGYGGLNKVISIAWYEFTASLKYYPVANRPATYDIETGWSYLPAYNVDDVTRATARSLVSNWLLERWDMVIEEGLRAKIYKRASDDNRAKTAYSLFKQLHKNLYTSEVGDVTGYRQN